MTYYTVVGTYNSNRQIAIKNKASRDLTSLTYAETTVYRPYLRLESSPVIDVDRNSG